MSALAAVVNSFEVFLVFAIGMRLRLSGAIALAGSLVPPLLPLFTARLTLAYFPALVGHAIERVLFRHAAAYWRYRSSMWATPAWL